MLPLGCQLTLKSGRFAVPPFLALVLVHEVMPEKDRPTPDLTQTLEELRQRHELLRRDFKMLRGVFEMLQSEMQRTRDEGLR